MLEETLCRWYPSYTVTREGHGKFRVERPGHCVFLTSTAIRNAGTIVSRISPGRGVREWIRHHVIVAIDISEGDEFSQVNIRAI